MKKLSLGVAAGLVAVASAVGVGLARPSQAVAQQYRVVEMKELARFKNLTVVAMNDKADVVANAYLGGRSVIVVVLAADTLSPRVIIFRTPKGFTSVSASGIDAEGTIAATGIRAGGWSVPYVGYSPSNGHTWFRLPVGRRASYQVDGIAANGDVVGTMVTSKGLPGRAVEWKRFFRGYGGPYSQAERLALSPGYTHSSASSIWSSGSRELIGGVQYKGNAPSDRYTIWSPLPSQSGRLGGSIRGSGLLRPPVAIGGWGTHFFVVGRLMGVDTGDGWRSTIQFTAHGARPGRIIRLPLPKYSGVECFYGANGVSAGPSGAFLGVGGISCIGTKLQPEALLWRGDKVVGLQTRIRAGSGWQLGDATAVNAHGQIVGTGKLNGRDAVYLLSRR